MLDVTVSKSFLTPQVLFVCVFSYRFCHMYLCWQSL